MLNLNQEGNGQVVVTDIKMPFWSMVTFMVKWTIASIPAIMILFGILLALTFASALFLGGMRALLSSLITADTTTSSTSVRAVVIEATPTPQIIRQIATPEPTVMVVEVAATPSPEASPTPCYENGVKVPCQKRLNNERISD